MRLREGAGQGEGAGGWLHERSEALVSEQEIDSLKPDRLMYD